MADPLDVPLEDLSREELEARCRRLATALATRVAVMQEALEDVLQDARAEGWDAAVAEITSSYTVPIPENPYETTEEKS